MMYTYEQMMARNKKEKHELVEKNIRKGELQKY